MREPLFTASGSDVFVSYVLIPFGDFKPEYFCSVFPHQLRRDFRLEQRLEVFHTVHTALSGPRNVSFCVHYGYVECVCPNYRCGRGRWTRTGGGREDEKMQCAGYGIEKGMVHVVSRRPLLFCKVLFPLFAAWGGVGAT